MPNHLRRQIRERVATDLTGLLTTGANVFQTRIFNLEKSKLPCLLIYTEEETVEISSMNSPRTVVRNLSLVVEGYASATSNLDNTLDQIGKEVEIAMAEDIDINSLATDSHLSDLSLSYSGEGSKPTGAIRMTYIIQYRNLENSPDSSV
tara:strand:+ start:86 stop:532 length:447 start_codon:yes stop_codon:yes gene_type:complete